MKKLKAVKIIEKDISKEIINEDKPRNQENKAVFHFEELEDLKNPKAKKIAISKATSIKD